ncbi:MAG: acyl carrier protein [Hyphomicrobiaceae bacterium]|nr:acyl carrier protein [Hyphomicrobiaceae bacterium]
MTENEAFELIKKALDETAAGLSAKVTMDSHLTKDEIVDSLDSMNFLFELEQLLGHKIEAIDETFDDFRVKRLIELISSH